jgi:hypothetical protein
MASPALARNGSHNAAHEQGNRVYQGNVYLGSDPDPQVQFDLGSVRRGRATVATEVHTLRCEKARPARYTEGESDAMLVVTSRATAASTAECFLMECP